MDKKPADVGEVPSRGVSAAALGRAALEELAEVGFDVRAAMAARAQADQASAEHRRMAGAPARFLGLGPLDALHGGVVSRLLRV
jgi:hypothetical protein